MTGSFTVKSSISVAVAIAAIVLSPLTLHAETMSTSLAHLSKSDSKPTSADAVEMEMEAIDAGIPDPGAEATALTSTSAADLDQQIAPIQRSGEIINPEAIEAIVPAQLPATAPATEAAALLNGGAIDSNATLAQVDVIDEQVETRYRLGYLGAGANLGLTGDTGLSDTGFAVFSKIPLESYLSLRPAVIFSDDVEVLLPATFDFEIGEDGEIPELLPYVGAGLAFSTGDDSELDLLLSSGLDIPIGRRFTATAGVNIAPFNSFDIGVLVGFAYNFEAATVTTTVPVIDAAAVRDVVADLRPNPSYLGVGFNIGVTGDSALGDDSFAVLSKIAFNPFLSVRPELLIDEEVTFLIPVTYDLPALTTEFITFAPYLGAGVSFSTGDNSNFDLLASAGIDIPITSDLAATVGVNLTPFDSFDLGARLGLVYLFESF